MGDSQERIKDFPKDARNAIGFNLYKIQIGKMPADWKPMPSIGKGVNEVRVKVETGIYRTLYIAKFTEAIYVLHAFKKKSRKTASRDIEQTKQRLRDVKQIKQVGLAE